MRENVFWTLLKVMTTALCVAACGSINLSEGPDCVPYCVDGAPYVCNADGMAVAAQPCADGFVCQLGSCAPNEGDGSGSSDANDTCTPTCDAGSCLGDGCGGICECDAGAVCSSGSCVTTCTPECDEKVCGDDGCGGSCGACDLPNFCVEGACTDTCTPECGERVCGDDGCGGTCGACPVDEFCVEGACSAECTPACGDNACGDDGCGGSCGTCPEGQSCAAGACVVVCTPECGDKNCGDDGCGGSCGSCVDAQVCAAGTCADTCTPDCEMKTCGDDGCGGSCGGCQGNESCTEGSCVCVPDCGDKACGADGCGGACGTCDTAGGEVCSDSGICECTAQASMGCSDATTTAWLDSCGNVGDVVLACPGGMVCEEGECLCASAYSVDCVVDSPNEIGSYDSCGVYEETLAVCEGGQVCQQGACMCAPVEALACAEDGDVYSVDSCGTPLELVEECLPGASCEAGACICSETTEKTCIEGAQGTPCCTPHASPKCGNESVDSCVCALMPSCCTGVWDEACIQVMEEEGCATCQGSWEVQPVALDSCAQMTPLGTCPEHYLCEGKGNCVQTEAFCDNQTDALLLEAQNMFGEDSNLDNGKCMDTSQVINLLSTCINDECAGDWACASTSTQGPCQELAGQCSEYPNCLSRMTCLEDCGTDEACIAGCLPGGLSKVLSNCLIGQLESDLLISTPCATCFGDYFDCTFNGCLTECTDELCIQSCLYENCLPNFFACMGPVQYICDAWCNEAECGEDWCGGSCGTCSEGATCQLDGTCLCDCDAQTCASQGFECGSFVCDSETCDSDASGCGNPGDPWANWDADGSVLNGGVVTELVPQIVGDLSGHTLSLNAGASINAPFMIVGDSTFVDGSDLLSLAFLTFDISNIPDNAVIESATLRLHQNSTEGELSFNSANYQSIVLEHVHLAGLNFASISALPTIAETATDEAPFVLSTTSKPGWRSADVAPALRYEQATCSPNVQFRMTWYPSLSGDGDNSMYNRVKFASDNADINQPVLEVSYRVGGVPFGGGIGGPGDGK